MYRPPPAQAIVHARTIYLWNIMAILLDLQNKPASGL